MITKARGIICAILTVLLLFTGMQGASASTARTGVIADCVHYRHKPHTIIIACGDGIVAATHLHYKHWRKTYASGLGRISQVSCVPDCADGKQINYKMRFWLRRRRDVAGREIFTRLKVHFTGRSPTKHKRKTYGLPRRPV